VPAQSIKDYKRNLRAILGFNGVELDVMTVQELEESVLSRGLTLPIVRLPEHYLRGRKWFTNRGDVDLCNCGALWPCPLDES